MFISALYLPSYLGCQRLEVRVGVVEVGNGLHTTLRKTSSSASKEGRRDPCLGFRV